MADEEEYSLITPPPLPPPPPFPYNKQNAAAPFRPSIAVIVAVLTTMFSITFLLLLYAKHCKRNSGYDGNPSSAPNNISATARRNSGIDRSIIESLPIFRFASLRGHKEGLECSVCLNRFESNEVLRLLPKCKHAFHVECVDTWLDAHSTCPLCRYRVDPEDVLLVEQIKLDNKEDRRSVDQQQQQKQQEERKSGVQVEKDEETRKSEELTRRIAGRHSSAGERKSNFLQIVIQRPGESSQCRRSVDSVVHPTTRKKRSESVAVGCFDRGGRKDGQLLLLSETAKEEAEAETEEERENFLRRFEHRITLSSEGGAHRRWSDLRPSDLLFLQSEMILRNSGRYSLSSHQRNKNKEKDVKVRIAEDEDDGKSVIKTRSVSEITGLKRFANRT